MSRLFGAMPFALIAAASLMIGLDSAQAELKYRVTPIALGYGEGINNKGDVVGILSGNNHAFLYKKGVTTDLGITASPSAVNNSEAVVGDFVNGYLDGFIPKFDAFLWQKGTMADIAQGTGDGGFAASATAINNPGDATGSYDAGPVFHIPSRSYGAPRAFLYRGGRFTDIGTLGGFFSVAGGINNAGQIVGIASSTASLADTDQSWEAYLYTNGRMQAIGGAQSGNFIPWAINDNGWITGTLSRTPTFLYTYNGEFAEPPLDPIGTYTAVLYINGRIKSLGTIPSHETSPSLTSSAGISINNNGVVVGNYITNTSSDPEGRGGFVYRDGRMYNLDDLVGGWKIVSVAHINDAGQIAATGTPDGSTATYALLLTPSQFADFAQKEHGKPTAEEEKHLGSAATGR
jgi:probable HAF family extracellular repeat protein